MASGRHAPDQLASGTKIKTLEGGWVRPGKVSGTCEVNNAHVVCGNVQTADAAVYVIGRAAVGRRSGRLRGTVARPASRIRWPCHARSSMITWTARPAAYRAAARRTPAVVINHKT